jgi:hypothetical protein
VAVLARRALPGQTAEAPLSALSSRQMVAVVALTGMSVRAMAAVVVVVRRQTLTRALVVVAARAEMARMLTPARRAPQSVGADEARKVDAAAAGVYLTLAWGTAVSASTGTAVAAVAVDRTATTQDDAGPDHLVAAWAGLREPQQVQVPLTQAAVVAARVATQGPQQQRQAGPVTCG